MYETSAPWTITGPDGTVVQMNMGGEFVLEEVSGFDSPNVRQNIDDLPEADGAVAGDFFFGSRPVTLKGKIIASSAAQRNAKVVQFQQAFRGLRGDVTLVSQPQGMPALRCTARLDNARITGGYVKDFLLGLVCPDPRIYSDLLHSLLATNAAATPGAAFPWTFAVDFGGGTGGTASVAASNVGNIAAPAVFVITGPISDPRITNAATGEWLYIDGLSLAAGESVTITTDPQARTVVSNSGANYYSRVRFPDSAWLQLQPGANAMTLWASSSSTGVSLTVSWRDSWA